jgi:hypothetical protein
MNYHHDAKDTKKISVIPSRYWRASVPEWFSAQQ